MPQVNLHNHGEGSFLDGLSHNHETVKRAQELGHQWVTLTDHGECNQHLAMAAECQKAGLGFVPGMEGYWLEPETLQWHRDQKDRKLRYPRPSHICQLAVTQEGLSNLWALSTEAYQAPYFDFKPIATPDLLRKYSAGIYASDGCMLTRFAEAVEANQEDQARAQLAILLDIYRERFYMELHTWQFMDDSKPEHSELNLRMRKINHAKVRFAQELGVPLVVVNDSHHAHPDAWLNKELLWAFQTSNDADKLEASLEAMAQKADHLMGEDEIYHWMRRHGINDDIVAEAIKNSEWIASQCKVEFGAPTMSMPRLGATEDDDLISLIKACEEGFNKYVIAEGLDEAVYMERLKEELTLIADKKFAGYFNIVRDCTDNFRSGTWAKFVKPGAPKEPLLIGPGRGSVGGSLVAYLTGIDIIDPIKYKTLFSRFLSPGRKGLPDIDIDVPQSQRKDILAFLRKRYGDDQVVSIGTMNRNGPKAAIKDLGRALKVPLADLNAINDHIEDVERLKDPNNPDEEDLTWGELIERKGGKLRPYQQKYPGLFAKVEELIGIIRNSSVHASGVLISAEPILGRVPLRATKNKAITTQFDMWDVEALGGVKFDWLGLRHLDTLSVARKLIYERHGVWIDYDRTGMSIPANCANVLRFGDEHFNDPVIWPQIEKGHTLGIFQVETPNCTTAAMDFKPKSERDLADLTSIIRPGVADAGLKDVYLRRRAGQEPVIYDHPLMENFVGPKWATNTYGVMVYQEQLIECVIELGGFTPDEADDLRKAVGKKLMEKLMPLKSKFLSGCLANPEFLSPLGGDPRRGALVVETIWASIEASGRYAFNWSHAVEYAMISSWEVWTKHYYAPEFLVALMATDSGNINKYLREARRRKTRILPPDVNKSGRKFTIDGDAVRYGLDTVDKVGAATSTAICEGQPYCSFEDYLKRSGRGASKTAIYNLTLIGALDSFGDRTYLLDRLERERAVEDLAESTMLSPDKVKMVVDRRLANNPKKYAIHRPDFHDPKVVYEIERKLVGTYVTVDPMERYLDALHASVDVHERLDVLRYEKGEEFTVGGQVSAVTTTVTKRGKTPGAEMAHMTVEWNGEDFRLVIWPETWRNTRLLIKVGAPVACRAKKLADGCCLEELTRLDLLFDREGIA